MSRLREILFVFTATCLLAWSAGAASAGDELLIAEIHGKVKSYDEKIVSVELAPRRIARVPRKRFEKAPRSGDVVTVMVTIDEMNEIERKLGK